MKRITTLFFTMLIATCMVTGLKAQQFKMPQPSTAQTITQEFGLGKITLSYSRPNMKGRKIFGGLVPYNEVWRTGANTATTINFTDDVMLEGNKVPAGEYGLFTIPGPDEWTIILNKTSKQWGAYTYKQADDFIRFKVKPTKLRDMAETFTMQFTDVKATSAELELVWEKTAVAIKLTADIDSRIMSGIDAAMKGDKKPYFAAAMYYYENGKDLNKALEWINEAEKSDQKAPYFKLWKARIQLKMGNKAGALATAQEGARLAKDQKNDEYIRLNEAVVKQAK